jgi:hypothetical protein
MMRRVRVCRSVAGMLLLAAWATDLRAQASDNAPSFTLATSQVFSTHDRPAITLVFRGVDHLDFRVYRVDDAFAFFEKLRDPHEFGSAAPIVPQERTWLERIAIWKAGRRAEVRAVVRRQFSLEYRRARRAREDVRQVVLRRTVDVNTFAQVPLLNRSQLVTSWRELLPAVRDAEFRRMPLDLRSPGIYVVEAVSAPLKAYTVVIVSDVGLLTKTAPGQLLVFAANRFSGDPISGCRVRVLADQQPVADGSTAGDGTFQTQVTTSGQPDNLITLAQCGDQTAATDPGAYTIRQPARDLVGYIYSDRPVYRPGDLVHYKGVLRWRDRGGLLPLSREPVEVTVVDEKEKVVQRDRKPVDDFGAVTGSFRVPPAASLGYYTVRVASGEYTATGSFEVQEYRKPEFDVAVRAQARFAIQGGRLVVTIDDGLKRLYDYQHPDGGWGWWKTDQDQPFMTAYALDGLLQARDNGVTLEDWRVASAAEALERLYAQYPGAVPDLKAYELYVLTRAAAARDEQDAGHDSVDLDAALNDLWSARSRMTASGRALLLLALDLRKDARADAVARELVDAARTTGELAWWPVSTDPLLDDMVDTTVEATGLSLKALSARDPRNPLLERAARWCAAMPRCRPSNAMDGSCIAKAPSPERRGPAISSSSV